MNLNIIKLNPSQTLRLIKERETFFCERSIPNGVEHDAMEKIVFTSPIICPVNEKFSRKDFLAIKKFSIYKIQKLDGAYFFPSLLELPMRTEHAVFLCATNFYNGMKFSLGKFFAAAEQIVKKADAAFWNKENFFFNATSFKFSKMEIEKGNWKTYDDLWKKIKSLK